MLDFTRRIGNRLYEWFALSELGYALTMLGRWDEALARTAEIPRGSVGAVSDLASPLTGVLELHLHRGELDEARQLLTRFEELGHSGDIQAEGAYRSAAAAVRLAEGKAAEALAFAEEAVAGRAVAGMAAQDVKFGFLHAVEAALELGDRAKTDELLSIVEELPVGLQPPFLAAEAQRFRARLAGDDPGADRLFTMAATMLRDLELPFHLAVVLLEHGEWLNALGRTGDAERLLAEAEETFARLGATPWLERVHRQTAAESVTAEA